MEVRPASLEDVPHFGALACTCLEFACVFIIYLFFKKACQMGVMEMVVIFRVPQGIVFI